jgi:hypothetical protein
VLSAEVWNVTLPAMNCELWGCICYLLWFYCRYIYWIEYTLSCLLLCLSFSHCYSGAHAGTQDSLLSPSELLCLTCCCWTVDRPHERSVGVDSELFCLKETWVISNFWQEFGSFLWGCNHTTGFGVTQGCSTSAVQVFLYYDGILIVLSSVSFCDRD